MTHSSTNRFDDQARRLLAFFGPTLDAQIADVEQQVAHGSPVAHLNTLALLRRARELRDACPMCGSGVGRCGPPLIEDAAP